MLPILDLFLLALIAEGIDTPYRWQRQAAVSTGASLPSIRRLAAGGFVREADSGPRGRRQFSLTAKGRNQLNSALSYFESAALQDHVDMESLLRLVSLAAASGRRELAVMMLQKAARDRTRRTKQAKPPGRMSSKMVECYSEALTRYEAKKDRAALACIESLIRTVSGVPLESTGRKPARPGR